MGCGSERIMFNSEWNYFCFRKDPVKQKPGERKGRKERGRESGEERKKRKGSEKEKKRKCLNRCCKLSNKTVLFNI